jgi:recombination protein RecT
MKLTTNIYQKVITMAMKKNEARAKAHKAMIKADPRVVTVKSMLKQAESQILAAVPAHYLKPERMIRIATSAIQRSEKLLECEPMSLVKSIIEAAELGLEVSSSLGHAYLVPFFNGKTKRMEAQLQIGYRGFIELACRDGKVTGLDTGVVYDCDSFTYEAIGENFKPKLEHIPSTNRPKDAKLLAAWAVAHLKDNTIPIVRVLFADDIERSRARSKSADKGPWSTDTAEMWRKTAVRSIAKYLPLSPNATRAATADEARDFGLDDAIDASFSLTPEATELVNSTTGEVTTQ